MDNKTSIILSATDKTQAAFASAKRNLEGLKNAAGGLNTALASVGAGLSVGAFAAFVENSIDAADNLNDLSKKTGIAVENLAGLQLVVDKSGTTMEMLGGGVAKLNKKLGEAALGGKEAQTLLRDLGITAADPIEAFYQLADAFGRFKNEGEKADAMSRVIGKTWGELAPALAEGGDGLRRMVEEGKSLNPVTKEMAEQADKFNDAMSRFKTQASGVGTAIANDMLPYLNGLLTQLNEGIRVFGGFGAAMELGLRSPFKDSGQHLNSLRAELEELEAKRAAIKPTSISHILTAGIDADIAQIKKFMEYYKALQGQEALALNDKFGTSRYKLPPVPGQKPISLTPSGSDKAAKSDPLASLLGQTEQGILAEHNRVLALIEQRYAANKLGASQYADALLILNERLDKSLGLGNTAALDAATKAAIDQNNADFEQLMAINDARIEQDEQAAAALGRMRDELSDLLDPIQKYRVELEKVDKLLEAGLISPEKAAAARLYWNEQMDAAAGFGAEITKVRSLTEDLGLTFESAFEGAIVEGKALSDVLNSLAQDVTRVFLRKTVTEPLGNWASSFFAGLFPSALGNVFAGGVPVRAFAAGGVVSSPTVFPLGLMGEAGPEAIMPLKRGSDGKLGVTGGGGTTINMVVHANDANSVRASMGQIKADLARAVSSARRNL